MSTLPSFWHTISAVDWCCGCCGWWCSGHARGARHTNSACSRRCATTMPASVSGATIGLHYGELEFPSAHLLQFILYGNGRYFCDARERDVDCIEDYYDGEQNEHGLENLDDGQMSSCSIVAGPRGCSTMTWDVLDTVLRLHVYLSILIPFWTSHSMWNASCKQHYYFPWFILSALRLGCHSFKKF